nr:restriction endonuclease [Streptomyces canus]
MAATHTPTRRTRKTRTRRRTWRLPRLGGWWIAVILTVIAVARTWPLYTGAVTALIAVALIIAVVRPRRLARPLNWATTLIRIINTHRTRMPAPGHRTLDAFQRMDHRQFEHAIAALAREDHNVTYARQVGQANDRGADVLIQVRGRRILIQAKHYQPGNNVGSETIQITNGVYRDIHHCDAAIIVTTAGFTRDAITTNTLLRAPIRLVDGHALTTWANGGTPPWS